ncbi:MAG: hypothetical protein LM572_00575 [Ignisphaera sp.]|nr:hypothetical protein [Ignisphaera sp.]
MPTKRIKCIVCNRTFFEGQGVKLVLGGKELYFHSKSCALKFVKSMVLYLDQKDLEKAVTSTLKEFEQRLQELEERSKKRIEAIH